MNSPPKFHRLNTWSSTASILEELRKSMLGNCRLAGRNWSLGLCFENYVWFLVYLIFSFQISLLLTDGRENNFMCHVVYHTILRQDVNQRHPKPDLGSLNLWTKMSLPFIIFSYTYFEMVKYILWLIKLLYGIDIH